MFVFRSLGSINLRFLGLETHFSYVIDQYLQLNWIQNREFLGWKGGEPETIVVRSKDYVMENFARSFGGDLK
jgi:hypothetical protein